MNRFGIALLAAALVCAGCATTNRKPKHTLGEGINENSEQRLWARSEEESRRLDRSGFLYEDRALEEYLNTVAHRVWNPGAAGPNIVIKVIKNPELNAFAYPSGRIYIHTGILASMENEAQLAVLLGHEITHVINRHAAKEFTKKKLRSESKGTLNAFLGTFGESLGQQAILVSVNGYSRELESESDREGLDHAVKAGYDPREAPRLHEQFKEEADIKQTKSSYAYSTHPKIQDRIDSYEGLLRTDYKDKQGALNADSYGQHTLRLLLDNAVLDLKLGNTKSAEKTVKKYLKWKPNEARGYFLMGEVLREQGPESEQEALVNYQRAVTLQQNYPEPYRAMGMMEYKKGAMLPARKHLERYLALRPDAQDRDYIRQYISECR